MKHRARTSSVASSPTCRSSAQTTVDRRPNHNTARGTPRSTSISINTNTTNNNKKTSAAHTSPASKRGKNLPAGRGLNGSALREHLPPPLKYWPLLTQTQRRNAMDLSRRAAATTSRRDTNNNNNNNSSAPPLPSTNTNTNNNNNNNSSNNGSSALSDDPQAFLDLLRLIKSMCCRVDPTEVASSTSLVLRGDGGASSPTKSANAHDGKHTTTHFSPARVGKLGGATNQVDHPTTTTSSSSVVMAPTKRSGGVGVVGVGATTGMPSTCGEAEMILWRLEEAQEALFPSPLATSGGVRLLPSKLPSIVPLRRSVSNNTIPPPTTTTNNVSAEMMNMMMMRGKGSTTTTTANVGAMVPRRKVWKVFIRDRTSAFSMLMAAARSEVVCADVRIAATLLTLIYNITRSLPMEVQRTSIRQCERLGLAKACGAVVRTCSAIPSTHTDCITINGHTGAALHIRAVESAGLLLALCASYSNNTSVFVRLSRGLSKLMQAAEMLASMVEQKLSNYRTLSDFDCSAATPHHKTNNNNNNNNVNGCVDGNNNNSGEASQRTRTTEAVLRLRDCTTPFTNPLLHMLLALFALCRSAATAQELGPRCAALCARSIATTSAFIIHTAPKLLHVMAIRGQDNNNSSGVLRCTTSGEHLEEVGGTFISISVASWLRHLELLTFWSAALLHRITSQASSSRVACSEAAMQCGAITSLFDIIAGTSNNNNNNKTSVEASTSILSVAPQPATTTTTTSSSSLTHRVVRSLRHPQLVHAALLAMESVVSGSRTRGVAEINKMGGLHVVAQHILSLPDRSLEELHRDYLQLCSLHNLRQLPAPDEVDPNAVNQRLPDHLRPRPPPRGTTTSRPTPNINNNNNNNMSEAASTTDAELANIEGGTMEVFDVDAHVDWLSPELRGGVVAAPTMLPEMHHCPLPWSFTAVGPPPMLRWMDEDDAHQHDGERLRPSTMEERKAVIRRQIHRLAQGPPADEMMSSGGGGETLPRHNIVFERDGAEVEVVADAAAASASTPPLHNNNSSSSSYTTPQLVFASNFESGNLQRAVRVGDDVYDLLLSFDTATNSFVQWFCFAISSYVPGHTYHFTIVNLEKTSSTFNEGQLPLLLHVPSSSSSSSLGGAAAAADDVDVVVADGGDAPRWQRTGEGVFYYQNSYERPPRNTLFPKKMVVGSASNNNNNNTSMSTIINANNSNSNNTSMSGRGGGTLDEGGSPLMPAKPRGNAPTTFPRRLGGSLNASTRTASPSRPPRSSLHGNKMPVGKRGSAAANTRRAAAGASTTSSPSLAGGGGSGVGSPTSCRSSNTNTTRKAASSSYYSLSFSITMPPAGGVVYLANCLPYTYTELRLHMQQLQKTLAPTCASSTQQQQHSRGTPSLHSSRSPSPSRGTTEDLTQMMASSSTTTHNNNNNSARGSSTTHAASPLMVQMLCRSTGGLPIPLLTLTNLIRRDTGELYATEDVQRRPVCVLVARVHPGESNSSWVMNGILDCLVAGARHLQQQQQQQQQKRGVVGVASGDDVVRDEAQHKQQQPPPQQQHDDDASTCAWAADLLDHFVFKIVPMLNVDGVVMGNHRCSLYGVDLNRDYLAPRSNINPVLYAVKQLIRYLTTREQRHVIMYADFHGHSRAKNFLLYGCTNTRTQKRTPANNNNNNKQQHRVSEAGSVGGGDALAATTNSTTNTSTAAAGSSIHDTTNNMSAAQSSSTTCVPTSSSSSWLAISPEKLFPSLLAHMNYAFNIAQNNFAMQKSKRSSGRVVMYREFGIRMSYGVEGTMMGGRGAIGVLPRPSSSPSPTTTATTTTTPMMMMQKSIYADVPNYSTISDEAPYYTSTYRYFGATFVAALAMLLKMERDVNRAAVVAAAGEYADELDGVGDGVVHDGDDVHGQQQQQQHQQHAMMMEAVATRAWAMTATAGTSKAPPVLSYSDGSMMAMSSNCNTRTTTNNNNNVPTHGVPLQQQREILFGLLRGNQQEMEELSDDDDDASVGGDSDDGDGATSTGGRSGRGGANSSGADAEASTSAANEACSSVEGSDDADDDDDDEGDDEVDDDDDSAWMDAPCETFDGDLPDSLNDML